MVGRDAHFDAYYKVFLILFRIFIYQYKSRPHEGSDYNNPGFFSKSYTLSQIQHLQSVMIHDCPGNCAYRFI